MHALSPKLEIRPFCSSPPFLLFFGGEFDVGLVCEKGRFFSACDVVSVRLFFFSQDVPRCFSRLSCFFETDFITRLGGGFRTMKRFVVSVLFPLLFWSLFDLMRKGFLPSLVIVLRSSPLLSMDFAFTLFFCLEFLPHHLSCRKPGVF